MHPARHSSNSKRWPTHRPPHPPPPQLTPPPPIPPVRPAPPPLPRLRLLLSELAGRLEAGENLYVHCWGGRGRAGTVGACLLAHLYGITADEALERVQRAFDTRKDGEHGGCRGVGVGSVLRGVTASCSALRCAAVPGVAVSRCCREEGACVCELRTCAARGPPAPRRAPTRLPARQRLHVCLPSICADASRAAPDSRVSPADKRRSPETEEQVAFVRRFIAEYTA